MLTLSLLLALAAAPSSTIAGVTVGQSPPFGECAIKTVKNAPGYKDFLTYVDYPADRDCWKRRFMDPRMGKLSTGRETVEAYTTTELPKGISQSIEVVLIDGVVEGVNLKTQGRAYQSVLLDALTEKFGKPESMRRAPVQNLMGAQFESLDAHWSFSDLDVSLRGMTKVSEGAIRLKSPALLAADGPKPQPKL